MIMRLIALDKNGQFSLTKNFIDNIPPYAILSHTWGDDEDEVTFNDFMDGSGKLKTGYGKIQLCGEQAARDGLRHFWIDTCCIDKSNNTEFSEAINSMFSWYRNAAICYVYLADVSIGSRDPFNLFLPTWETDFRHSRWFTRGWTLQELLAPSFVSFFTSEWKRLGDRESLEYLLHEITGVAVKALQGYPLSEFSIKDRIVWAKSRKTKREEDKAYSLLGIFNVYISPLYGEGKKNAFRRLRDEILKTQKHPSNDLHDISFLVSDYQFEASYGWYCCNCGNGPWILAHSPRCVSCEHDWCFECDGVYLPNTT
jgi:hypothetical protein